MKRLTVTFLVASLISVSSIQAQSVQEGVNDLYAERFKSAKATFEKLLAANPNNIEATYWLGQTYIEMEDLPGAKAVYEKALLASANAPLVIVGMGQVELMEKKVSEARQRFEAAITMTSTRKGEDPEILNAVGRAITNTYNDKEKLGDINYAIQKLEQATQQKKVPDQLMADIYLNLGNAHRKAKPGESGGLAYTNYQNAINANPNFPVPYYRMAQLFNSQRNWEMFERFLNDAVAKDPRFAPAYYDLYYYKLGRLDFVAAEDFAKKFIANTDPDPQNDYLRVQTLWAKKDYDQAIQGAQAIIAQTGAQTKARVYKLIADAYVQKKDSAAGKEFIDQYFAKATPEEVIALDYKLKADIYSAIPGQEDTLFAIYQEGVAADTSVENKIELLKKGAEFFRNAGQREREGDLMEMLVQLKPKPTINEMFDVGRAYYFGGAYQKSYEAFERFEKEYPDQVYGYEWKLNNARVIDTIQRDSIAVPAAVNLLAFAEKDTAKYKKQYLSAAGYLVEYYANYAKDNAKAIEYLKKMLILDPENTNLRGVLEQLERTAQQSPSSSNKPRSGSSSKVQKPELRQTEQV